jgi:DNA-binding MarR family transcriptional regulator
VLPSDSPLLLLQRATHVTLRLLAEELTNLEMPASELNALANLESDADITVSELSLRTGTRSTTLTSVLDRLAGRGYIERVPNPADRRSVLIVVTETGVAVRRKILKAVGSVEARTLGHLDEATLAGFRRALAALIEEEGL